MRRRGTSLVGLLLSVLIVVAAGCSDNRREVDDTHRVRQKYFPVELTGTETSKTASCSAGDVLVGGGYQVRRVSLDLANAVSVRSSRPNGSNGWLLTVVRRPTTPPGAVSVSLYIYCLHRTDGNPITVSSETVAGGASTLQSSPSGLASGGASAGCRTDQTLTAGGSEIILGVPEPSNRSASYNSWIRASLSETDRRSWRVQASFIENGDPLPRVRAYAQCLTDPDDVLKPAQSDDVEADRRSGFNFDFYEGFARCGSEAFASSGGFVFRGDALIPHSVLTNHIGSDFRGWHVLGIYGLQTGGSSGLAIRPVCFAGLEIEKPVQVDLIPLIGDEPLGSVGCPAGASDCFTFTVANAGNAPAPATEAEISGGTAQPVRNPVPPLGPGESVVLTIGVDATDLCGDNCSVQVEVDPADAVTESNETNNRASWFSVG